MKQRLVHIYDVHYKKLMILSFIILLASVLSLGITYAKTGEFFQKGVSLKGGITMTVPIDSAVDADALEATLLAANPRSEISVREITEAGRVKALIVEAADITSEDLQASLTTAGIRLDAGKYSVENMGGSLGEGFFRQTIRAVIFAFIAMAIVVFFTFRSAIPSIFIIVSAISDVISTIAFLNILSIKVSTAGIAALLMLIGYGVDNNILLTTKVLKRRTEGGTLFERTLSATRTGTFMTLTSFIASVIGYIFSQSDTVKQIMLIIAVGMVFDMIYTYFQNAGILRIYMEKKYGKN